MSPFALLITCCLTLASGRPSDRNDNPVVFLEDKPAKLDDNVITPPILPIIDHLENDPTTLTREDVEKRARKIDRQQHLPKVSMSSNFNYSPADDGGVNIFYSRGFSGNVGDDRNRAGSHTMKVTGSRDKGFSVHHSSSRSNILTGNEAHFGNLGNSGSASLSGHHGTGFVTRFQDAHASSSLGFPPGVAEKFFNQVLQNEEKYEQEFSTHSKFEENSRAFPEQISDFRNGPTNSVPTHEIHYINLGSRNSENNFRFPEESTDRYSKIQYQTVPIYDNQNKKKPSLYDIIRIEV